MDEMLFVYGTLRDPSIQAKIIGRIIEGINDILSGFEIGALNIDGETFPILTVKSGSLINGEILKLSNEELAKVDVYETNAYRRVKVKLESGTEAWVFMK